jgi:indolepyruvate ferredoxin oxidoreductase beta subunit
MEKNRVKNILIVGCGGQGVILASEILSYVAVSCGFDAKKSEIHGMSQRGGVVTSHVRYGEHVSSPTIMEGSADILLSFEIAETLRWISYLKKDGKVITSRQQIVPPIVSTGLTSYPADIEAVLKERTDNPIIADALPKAVELGNAKLVNTLLLGMASNYLDLPVAEWKSVIEKSVPPKFKELNVTAFDCGRDLR